MDSFDFSELHRRFDNLINDGIIEEVSGRLAKVKIGTGDDFYITDWLPWSETRHGRVKTKFTPIKGEIVTVLCDAGEPGVGIIFGGLSNDNSTPPFADGIDGIEFSPGNHVNFDFNSGTMQVKSTSKIEILSGDAKIILQNGAVTILGNSVDIGGTNGAGVARIGDSVANGKIISGSSKVRAV